MYWLVPLAFFSFHDQPLMIVLLDSKVTIVLTWTSVQLAIILATETSTVGIPRAALNVTAQKVSTQLKKTV